MCPVNKPQLNATDSTAVTVSSEHPPSKSYISQRTFRRDHGIAAWYRHFVVNFTIVDIFRFLTNSVQYFYLVVFVTTGVKRFQVVDIGNDKIRPKSNGQFVVALVMRRESVDDSLMQYCFAKLDRGRNAKFVTMSDKVETDKYAQIVLPTENQRFAPGILPETSDAGNLNAPFVLGSIFSARGEVPDIDIYLIAQSVSINLILCGMLS